MTRACRTSVSQGRATRGTVRSGRCVGPARAPRACVCGEGRRRKGTHDTQRGAPTPLRPTPFPTTTTTQSTLTVEVELAHERAEVLVLEEVRQQLGEPLLILSVSRQRRGRLSAEDDHSRRRSDRFNADLTSFRAGSGGRNEGASRARLTLDRLLRPPVPASMSKRPPATRRKRNGVERAVHRGRPNAVPTWIQFRSSCAREITPCAAAAGRETDEVHRGGQSGNTGSRGRHRAHPNHPLCAGAPGGVGLLVFAHVVARTLMRKLSPCSLHAHTSATQ